jgi:hypothetical protein
MSLVHLSVTRLSGLGLLLLAGCAAPPAGPDAPWALPAEGGLLHLQQPITVAANRTRSFIQQGRSLPGGGINQLEPSCNLEVHTLADQPRTLEPDRLQILGSRRQVETVVQAPVPREGPFQRVGLSGGGDSPPDIMHVIHFTLQSERQPDVMRLTCRGALAEPWRARPPSLNEMRAALGAIATLELTAEAEAGGGTEGHGRDLTRHRGRRVLQWTWWTLISARRWRSTLRARAGRW